jgi:Na(+)-translocating NADH:ubiquinone oxidoreductase F subunit
MDLKLLEKEIRDYSLVGKETKIAIENGLADATWYTSPVPREKMRELLERRNGPAIRDTFIWFGLIFGFGYFSVLLWGTWWFILPYLAYSTLYASTSDSRWHESSHGTAFKTDWMNNALYEVASFMVTRQSTVWRWSHTRHHSDTIIRGRDPEIAVQRPPIIKNIILNFFALKSVPAEFRRLLIHASGRIEKEVATYLPKSEYKTVILKARIYVMIYLSVIALSIVYSSILPILLIGVSTFVGSWLMPIYGLTQHAGLAENVLDHRLNCRTVYMNRIHRFLYWNMNYHVEHHMFPLVPYHALPKLHELIKNDCPPAYPGIVNAFREIIPAVVKQSKDPSYFVERKLPSTSNQKVRQTHKFVGTKEKRETNGWIKICETSQLQKNEVVRFDCDEDTFAIYQTSDGNYYATDGMCTHANMHLSEGMVLGNQIECAKHNGRFKITDGSAQRPPVCVGLKTYKVMEKDNSLFIDIDSAGGGGVNEKRLGFKVISNNNVATFIKELVLEPIENTVGFKFKPGEYIRLEIPAHETEFKTIEVNEPFRSTWKQQNIFNYYSFNTTKTRRNYSMANNPADAGQIKFNVRIATPPPGINCSAGYGSSYVFNLKPGDTVFATGPFGDFHIKPSDNEMVYVGGGAGMAPLRSHISYLFETLKTGRKVSFWYGARSLSELYYDGYFRDLEKQCPNFSFHVALSDPLPTEFWGSHTGLIHEILDREFLLKTEGADKKEFYLCGPPAMIGSVQSTLAKYNVPDGMISFDEF